MDILSRFEGIVAQSPDKTAFVDRSETLSFGDLAAQAQRCACYLQQIGVSKGDRCIVSEDNSTSAAAVILAIWYCGAIPVLLHSQSTQAHTQIAIFKTGARLLITSALSNSDIDMTATHCFSSQSIVTESEKQKSHSKLHSRSAVPATAIASIVFTSGSTGGPKGVCQTHQSLISGCNSVFHCLKFNLNDTILCPVPWSFDYGFGQLLTTLLTGITQIIPESNSPFTICAALETDKPSVFVGVPSLFAGICQGLSPIANTDTSSVRLITSTGSKLHSSTIEALRCSFPNASISLNYGLTETYRTASLPVDAFETHSSSVGLAIPGVCISVIRPDNSTADVGELGEIVHSGSGVFAGYWGDQERTNAIRRNDPSWNTDDIQAPPVVFTGDLGWKDENGYLYIKGRKDRQIKTMGVLVSPDEVETILLNQDQLLEAAIVSKPHETLGELIVAVCVLKHNDSLSKKEIKIFCRQNMTPYMMPREIHIIETMPRTSTGKIDYAQLRLLYTEDCPNTSPVSGQS